MVEREQTVPVAAAAAPARSASKRPIRWTRVLIYAILIIGLLQAVFPFFWMVSASLMSLGEVTKGNLLPGEIHLENYALAWERANFAQFMWNSVRITVITVVGQLLFCIPAAYAFARMRFFGRTLLFALLLATLMIPDVAILVPNYLTVVWLGRLSESLLGISWMNNWPALTIPFMASAFTIFLLRQFFSQIPEDFWDAVRIDGGGHLRFLWSVVVPLSRAPIMTVVTFSFIASWNALLWPLLVTQTDEWRPVALGLTKFVSSDAPADLHLQMAASVIMVIPILILYFITQRQFTEGIAASGVKG